MTGLSCLCFCSSQLSLFCLHFREAFRFPAMPCGWSLPSARQEAILFLPGLSCGCWKDSCLFTVQLSLSCLLLRLLLSLPFDSFAAQGLGVGSIHPRAFGFIELIVCDLNLSLIWGLPQLVHHQTLPLPCCPLFHMTFPSCIVPLLSIPNNFGIIFFSFSQVFASHNFSLDVFYWPIICFSSQRWLIWFKLII